MNEFINNDWYKIIAIRFDDIILFGQRALDTLNQKQDYDQLISLAEFKFMSRLDLGEKWGKYAEISPILFELKPGTALNIRQPKMICHRIV